MSGSTPSPSEQSFRQQLGLEQERYDTDIASLKSSIGKASIDKEKVQQLRDEILANMHVMASCIHAMKRQCKLCLESESSTKHERRPTPGTSSERIVRSSRHRRMAIVFLIHEIFNWRYEQYKSHVDSDGHRFQVSRSLSAI